jgi:GMP synthase-like glutamine amidotransferase
MKTLRIHFFQHVSFEGLGSIEEWAALNGHLLTSTKFYEKVWFPKHSEIDWLIVMGGPMSVSDEARHTWLQSEKQFIRKAIDEGKTVLGICLGSQLISDALGTRVYKNSEKEIGWFDVDLSDSGKDSRLLFGMEDRLKTFHWHGDTFDLPEDAIHLFSSKATRNQGYVYKDRVVAMQFHPEMTLKSLKLMLEYCRNDLTPGKYVQTEEDIINNIELAEANRKVLFTFLDRLAKEE